MEIILLWTIWATAFSSPPDLEVLEQMCRGTHPEGRITISTEMLAWNERHYPAAMIICARKDRSGSNDEAPAEPLPRTAGKTPV